MSKSCCDKEELEKDEKPSVSELNDVEIKKAVAEGFGKFGASGSKRDRPCCQKEASIINVETRYSKKELASVPEEVVDVSAGCGNPLRLVEVKEGQTVVDLGCGGGIDVFLAANKVGSRGKVIGIDGAQGMIERAKRAAERAGYKNVQFLLGDIESFPEIEDESADTVISNCVINLCPNKDKVFAEAFRVLKPGGKLSVSDTTTQGDLPAEIRNDLELWVKCISGAINEKKYKEIIEKAGFENVEMKEHFVYTKESLGALLNIIEGEEANRMKKLLQASVPITSSKFVAVKPI